MCYIHRTSELAIYRRGLSPHMPSGRMWRHLPIELSLKRFQARIKVAAEYYAA
jgi:hypothetical protein